MITLLVKIMYKYEIKTNGSPISSIRKNVPKFEFKKEISESRIGGEHYFISNVLRKAASISLKCEKEIEEAIRNIEDSNQASENLDDELM